MVVQEIYLKLKISSYEISHWVHHILVFLYYIRQEGEVMETDKISLPSASRTAYRVFHIFYYNSQILKISNSFLFVVDNEETIEFEIFFVIILN